MILPENATSFPHHDIAGRNGVCVRPICGGRARGGILLRGISFAYACIRVFSEMPRVPIRAPRPSHPILWPCHHSGAGYACAPYTIFSRHHRQHPP
jgi:hypothetical protein